MIRKIGYKCHSGSDGCKMSFGNELIIKNDVALATAHVAVQDYDNLTDPRDALCMGTFFCDLYMPYDVSANRKGGCGCD